MLLHSVHTLANFVFKEIVPPQPRTSPRVTAKNIKTTQWIQGTLCFFRASAVAQKSWM